MAKGGTAQGGGGAVIRPFLAAVLALVLGAAVARAADSGAGRPKELRMKEVEIRGEVEQPGVFYIIPRRRVELDLGPQTRDYRDEILQPLDPAVFEARVRARTGR